MHFLIFRHFGEVKQWRFRAIKHSDKTCVKLSISSFLSSCVQLVYVFCFWFLPSVRMRFLMICMSANSCFWSVRFCKILIPTLGHNQKHETQRGYAHLKCKRLNVRPAWGNNTIFWDFQASFLVLIRGLRKSKLTYLRMNLHVFKFRRWAVLANPHFCCFCITFIVSSDLRRSTLIKASTSGSNKVV